MNALNNTYTKGIQEVSQKDKSKGQKILAAVYLVTNHLPETDAIRQAIRTTTAAFVCATPREAQELFRSLEILLGGAVFAGMISEKNSSVIVYEMKRWSEALSFEEGSHHLEVLFRDQGEGEHARSIKDIKKTIHGGLVRSPHQGGSLLSHTVASTKNIIHKSARQDTILSFINDRKSAVIKDITSLFPEVSEKTIQRELNTLIDEGKITKRGSKRWSMYMAVNSLL